MAQKVFLNMETLKLLSLFEKITRSKVKDCFEDRNNTLIFVVFPGELRKSIGKKGINVKKFENLLKRKIKIIEFQDDITKFIKSLIFPMRIKDINIGDYESLLIEEKENAIITIISEDHKNRGLIIGRNANNLRNYEFIVKKYYPLKEIKVN